MTTTITSSIGTSGRDYSTVSAWIAACPADLVAVDQIWRGECYNDSEFGDVVSMSGITSNASCYPVLTCAAGHSFTENAGKLTNALRYNVANGVGFRVVENYKNMLMLSTPYMRVIGIQFYYDSAYASNYFSPGGMLGSNQIVSNCLFQTRRDGGPSFKAGGNGGSAVNCVAIHLGGGSRGMQASGTCQITNLTIIRPSNLSTAGTGLQYEYASSPICQNIAILGPFSTCFGSITYNAASSNNASSDTTAPGSGSLTGLSASTELTGPTSTALDVRPATGSLLAAQGVRAQSATNDLDIMGQSRSTTAPSIGAWEIVAAVASYHPKSNIPAIGPILAQ